MTITRNRGYDREDETELTCAEAAKAVHMALWIGMGVMNGVFTMVILEDWITSGRPARTAPDIFIMSYAFLGAVGGYKIGSAVEQGLVSIANKACSFFTREQHHNQIAEQEHKQVMRR